MTERSPEPSLLTYARGPWGGGKTAAAASAAFDGAADVRDAEDTGLPASGAAPLGAVRHAERKTIAKIVARVIPQSSSPTRSEAKVYYRPVTRARARSCRIGAIAAIPVAFASSRAHAQATPVSPVSAAEPAAPPAPSVPSDVAPLATPMSTTEQDEDYVEVRGTGWSSPRGLGDIRIKRELIEASPRQMTSEMLSAAPGFFVDHEEGEGVGNDVFVRGFDADHGSGIEMRVGSIPLNIPAHIQGQGYADANFMIPEVVRSIRVLAGPFDPRQGDAAIAGSAYFDLGMAERGYRLKSTYGSFDQWRIVGIVAPRDADEETFAAASFRQTSGFGQNRAGQSGSVNAQYGFDIGARDHVRLLATAYSAQSSIAGVVRQDDLDAGRIGYASSYPHFAQGQGVESSRVIVGADFDHVTSGGGRFEVAPWLMWTDFRARQNFTGNLLSSHIVPAEPGLGDLFETTNGEAAAGLTTRFHATPVRIGNALEIGGEPGITVRAGRTHQAKSLLNPNDLQPWDRRVDGGLITLDAGAYLDIDVRLLKRLRLSGGLRADLLVESLDGGLGNATPGAGAGAARDVASVVVGPRVTVGYQVTRELGAMVSYGEGFRSLDALTLQNGAAQPYATVRSVEAGFRMQTSGEAYTTTVAAFETWAGNDLVFDAVAGGFEPEAATLRRGIVGSVVAKPLGWLLASTALSVTSATFSSPAGDVGRYVPNVPPILFRADVSAHAPIARIRNGEVIGRAGVGYTFFSPRHVTDTVVAPAVHVLNANAAVRYGWLEFALDVYNVLGLEYPDDQQVYVSNWSPLPGARPPSLANHIVAAPPRTVLGTVSAYF
jgi:iron complex outermembrane receptor protein